MFVTSFQNEEETNNALSGWTYNWTVFSDPTGVDNPGFRDALHGQCIRYGDIIYLQVTPRVWLSGVRAESGGVTTTGEIVQALIYHDPSEQGWLSRYEWIFRSSLGSGDSDASADVDPARGRCVQEHSFVYLQNNNKDHRWMSGGRSAENEQVVTRNALESDYERNGEVSYQWMLRKSVGNGLRTDGFYCSADSAKGTWVPIDVASQDSTRRANFTGGIVARNHNASPFWEKTRPWDLSVMHSVTGGFRFGDAELDVSWLSGSELFASTSSAVHTHSTTPRFISVGPGQAWQFVYEISDISVPSWELRTADIVVTSSKNENPCCLPGLALDANNPHGPCKLSSPCQCGDSICTVPATEFEVLLSVQTNDYGNLRAPDPEKSGGVRLQGLASSLLAATTALFGFVLFLSHIV